MNAAQNELAAKETQAAALREQLAPFQFWCSSCGWRWPESFTRRANRCFSQVLLFLRDLCDIIDCSDSVAEKTLVLMCW
jgi:hypothetical protein